MTHEGPRLVDRLWFWVAASVATVFAAGFFCFGASALNLVAILLILLLVPMVLAALLSGRGLLRTVTGRSRDLHLWGATWLRGLPALVVPAVLLALLAGLRESESALAYEANLYRSSSNQQSSWSDRFIQTSGMATILGGEPVDAPSWKGTATGFTLDAVDTEFRRAVAEELDRLAVPAGTSLAEVRLEAAEPSSWTPFYKRVVIPYQGTVTLQVTRREDHRIRWVGIFESEQDVTVTGFLSSRDFVRMMGHHVGAKISEHILKKLPELEEKLGA